MKRLQNKVAVITGGCSGIGRATVELFAAEGARVVVGDVQTDKGQDLAARLGDAVRFRRCDVTRESDIKELMEYAASTFGGIDVVFNNAGAGGARETIDAIDGEGWDRTMSLLLRSVALGIRYATPYLQARGGGSIINTASVAALQAGAAPVAYSVAKAGVLHLTKVSAAQLGRFNIRVNAICPGFILTSIFSTGMQTEGLAPEAIDAVLKQVAPTAQPIAKAGMPEDIAQACLFFASSEAPFVTGAHLVVDGGLTVGPRSAWDPSTPSLTGQIREILQSQGG